MFHSQKEYKKGRYGHSLNKLQSNNWNTVDSNNSDSKTFTLEEDKKHSNEDQAFPHLDIWSDQGMREKRYYQFIYTKYYQKSAQKVTVLSSKM